MHKIKLVFFSMLVFLLLGLGGNNIEVDNKKFLTISTSSFVESLLGAGFTTLEDYKNNEYLLMEHPDFQNVFVRIYAESILKNTNAIVVELPIKSKFIVMDKNKVKLSEELLSFLKAAFNELPCNDNINFLRSGFECPNEYDVIYTVFEDQLNGLRNVLGIAENKQLYLRVVPIK